MTDRSISTLRLQQAAQERSRRLLDSGRVRPVRGGRWGVQQLSDGQWATTTVGMGYERRVDADGDVERANRLQPGRFRVIDKQVQHGERVLTDATCADCGRVCNVFVVPGAEFVCGDCSPWRDRAQRGCRRALEYIHDWAALGGEWGEQPSPTLAQPTHTGGTDMTLDTRIIIQQPTDPREVFDYCRAMIGATDEHTWEATKSDIWDNPGYRNHAGQGLPALLYVFHGADGPLAEHNYDTGETELREPHGYVEVSFDTTYGYKGPGGLGCGELHAGYVAVVGRWCEERGLPYVWQNEFTGEWHDDWRKAPAELGQSGEDAAAWFANVVKPAILSGAFTEAPDGPE